MKKLLFLIFISCMLVSQTLYAHIPFNRIVVFGDSLSDDGYQDLLPLPDNKTPIWTTPGGHTWAYYVAKTLTPQNPGETTNNVSPPADNTYVSGDKQGNDYAAGGAATSGQGIGTKDYHPPSLQQQIQSYLSFHGDIADSQTLYIVWAGSNDILLKRCPVTAAKNVINSLKLLHSKGATNIMVINIPDISKAPFAVLSKKPALSLFLKAAADAYNIKLALQISHLPYVKLFRSHALFQQVVKQHQITIDGKTFAFANVQQPACDIPAGGNILDIEAISCIPPTSHQHYFFEDGLHPTDYGHQALAAEMVHFIKATYH